MVFVGSFKFSFWFAGAKGGLGGLPNLLKEEEKEEDEQKKKEDDDKEEMEGKRRDEEDMHDSLVVETGMMVKFPLVPFPCFKVLLPRRSKITTS